MTYKKFMKYYLLLMSLLFPAVLYFEFADAEVSDIFDYMDYIFWFTALVGIYGYCYNKNIFTKQVWKIYLPFLIIWDLFIFSKEIYSDPDLLEPLLFFICVVVYMFFLLPEYVGLYFYGYTNTIETT